MKKLAVRLWNGLFPVPNVTPLEGLLLRALFAGVLLWFFPTMVQHAKQPEPVGLAHWFDLTWLHDAAVFAIYRAVFFGLLIAFAAGIALPATLPVLTVMHILPLTLHNSQGFTFHGNQILSLTLIGMAVTVLYFALIGKAPVLARSQGARLLTALAVIGAEALLLYFVEKQYRLTSLFATFVVPDSAVVMGLGNILVFGVVMAACVAVPVWLARTFDAETPPVREVDSWLLLIAQFVIAAAYLVSVCSKFYRSDGEWLVNSHYFALDFVKTLRQNFYSSLDPQYAIDPPAYIITMLKHPVLTAIFFDIGLVLETLMVFAVGNRKWTFIFGVSLIFMHIVIWNVMNLFFPTHIAMLTVFWVMPWVFGLLPGRASQKAAVPRAALA